MQIVIYLNFCSPDCSGLSGLMAGGFSIHSRTNSFSYTNPFRTFSKEKMQQQNMINKLWENLLVLRIL